MRGWDMPITIAPDAVAANGEVDSRVLAFVGMTGFVQKASSAKESAHFTEEGGLDTIKSAIGRILMTTINTVEDFLRAMRENDELRSAVRRELLSEELLALPQRFAEAFSKHTKDFAEHKEAFTDLSGAFTEHKEDFAEHKEAFNELSGAFSKHTEDFAENKETTDGEVKGMFMERAAREDAPIIANDMGLEWRKTLGQNELVAIANEAARSGLAADISRDNMRAFRRADLVMEAADDDGQIHYIAVEISYTADSRDTVRAMRHAEYLTRFTGIPTYAAISSVHVDNRIRDILTEDSPKPLGVNRETRLFWSRLPESESPN